MKKVVLTNFVGKSTSVLCIYRKNVTMFIRYCMSKKSMLVSIAVYEKIGLATELWNSV